MLLANNDLYILLHYLHIKKVPLAEFYNFLKTNMVDESDKALEKTNTLSLKTVGRTLYLSTKTMRNLCRFAQLDRFFCLHDALEYMCFDQLSSVKLTFCPSPMKNVLNFNNISSPTEMNRNPVVRSV